MDDLTRREAGKLAAAGVVALGASTVWAADPAQVHRGDRPRGSAKVLNEVLGEKPVIDRAELRKLVATALDKHGAHLVNWWWRGQPAIDAAVCRLTVDPKAVGDLVRDLYGTRLQPTVVVFPYGIPAIEQFLVQVVVGAYPWPSPW